MFKYYCEVDCRLKLEQGRRETKNKEHCSTSTCWGIKKVFSQPLCFLHVIFLSGHMTGPLLIMWLINQLDHFAKTHKNHPVKHVPMSAFCFQGFMNKERGHLCFMRHFLIYYCLGVILVEENSLCRHLSERNVRKKILVVLLCIGDNNIRGFCKAWPEWKCNGLIACPLMIDKTFESFIQWKYQISCVKSCLHVSYS